jgi:hypothetical protein
LDGDLTLNQTCLVASSHFSASNISVFVKKTTLAEMMFNVIGVFLRAIASLSPVKVAVVMFRYGSVQTFVKP